MKRAQNSLRTTCSSIPSGIGPLLENSFWGPKMAKISLESDFSYLLFEVSSSFGVFDCHVLLPCIALRTLVLKHDDVNICRLFPHRKHHSMPRWHQQVVHHAHTRVGLPRVAYGWSKLIFSKSGVRPLGMLKQVVLACFEPMVPYFSPQKMVNGLEDGLKNRVP